MLISLLTSAETEFPVIAKVFSRLFHCPLRLVEVTWSVLPTLRFSREFGLVFFVELRFFLRLAGCLFQLKFTRFFGLFVADFCFSDCFFFKFYGNFLFQFAPKGMWVCFCKNLVILSVFFRICHHPFLNNLLADFLFCCISCQCMLGLFLGQITYFWLVFHISLLVFAK